MNTIEIVQQHEGEVFEIKVSYEQKDDYGNIVTLYRREFHTIDQINGQIEMYGNQLRLAQDKKDAILGNKEPTS